MWRQVLFIDLIPLRRIAHLWHILSVKFLASKTTALWILWQTLPSHPSTSHIATAKGHGIKKSDSLAKVKVPISCIATKSKPLRSVHCQGKILILWCIWKLSKEIKRNVFIRFDIHEHISFSCRSPDLWRMDQVTFCGKLVL